MMLKRISPTLYKTIARVGIRPTLQFYDRMYEAAEAIEGYRDWETDRLSVLRRDKVNRCSLQISHRHLTYEQYRGTPQQEDERCAYAFPVLLDILRIDMLLDLFHQHVYLVDFPGSFDGLSALMRTKFSIANAPLEACLPGKYVDFSYHRISQDNLITYDIQIGPMWGKQAEEAVSVNKSHLDTEDPERDYVKAMGDIPPTSLFFNIKTTRQALDPYKSNSIPYARLEPIEIGEMLPFFQKARATSQQSITDVLEYILQEKVSFQ